MKKNLILLLCIYSTFNVFSQIFEQGTITLVNNKKEKTEIYVSFLLGTPQLVKVKNDKGGVISKDVWTLNGFEFTPRDGSKSVFVAKTVKINQSSTNLDKLEDFPEPTMKEKRLFLEVILLGEINLYRYNAINIEHFFVEKNGEIQELINKTYRRKSDKSVVENRLYRQQLSELMKIKPELYKQISNLPFFETSIVKILTAYMDKSNVTTPTIKPISKFGAKTSIYVGLGYQKTFMRETNAFANAFRVGWLQTLHRISKKDNIGIYTEFNVNSHVSPPIETYEKVILSPTEWGKNLASRDNYNMSYLLVQPMIRYTFLNKKVKLYTQAGLNIGMILKQTRRAEKYDYKGMLISDQTYKSGFDKTLNSGWVAALGASYGRFSIEVRKDKINANLRTNVYNSFFEESQSVNLFFRLY